jgi:hypothetical protein
LMSRFFGRSRSNSKKPVGFPIRSDSCGKMNFKFK